MKLMKPSEIEERIIKLRLERSENKKEIRRLKKRNEVAFGRMIRYFDKLTMI